MDLSKAFDTLNHELLIAKRHAYRFGRESLMLLLSYFSNRWQRTKINTSFSSWTELLQGVPQGSVLGPLLFNIYLNDLFFYLDCNVCNFADDTTSFVCNENLDFVLGELEQNSNIAIDWFLSNYMKMNSDQCYLLVVGHEFEQIWAKIGTDLIWESNSVKLLGITIDNHLKFDKHISLLCAKATRKLSALARISYYLTFHQKRTLIKGFFESQFRYCSLTWMSHSRKSNNKINLLHERALRMIYNDQISSFQELLDKDNSFTVHHFNIKSLSLAIEMFKAINNIVAAIIGNLFTTYHSYNLRSKSKFVVPSVHTVHNGQNYMQYHGPLFWNMIPGYIKDSETLDIFKDKIRKWKPINCPCCLCKKYISNLGFINQI